jgi:CBS domain-containing protein
MSLLRIAHVPPPIVEPDVSVMDAVRVMAQDRVGAVAVVEKGDLRGIFTERDLMLRVVKQERDPRTTLVRDVMTAEVKTISELFTAEEASSVMLLGHLRHLPILNLDGKVLARTDFRTSVRK